jgi:DNA-binding PadR family transcriptional regulator
MTAESHSSPLARRYCRGRRPSSVKPHLRYRAITASLCANTSRESLCRPGAGPGRWPPAAAPGRPRTRAGAPNMLLSHGLFGAPLGSHWLGGAGPLSSQGAVSAGLFLLLAAIGWLPGSPRTGKADRIGSEPCTARLYTQYNTAHDACWEGGMSVRHALLALLSEGPKYGLQLREEFEARTGEVWPLNVGQVYTTLQRLERDGLVESDDATEVGPQKGFRITAEGADELAGWLRTPPDLSSPPRDELVMKVLVALRVPGVNVHEVIQVHRRYLVELMQQWTRLKEDEADFDLGLALVVDAELFRLDSVIRWLDAADGRLKRAAADQTAGTTAAPANQPAPPPLPNRRRRAGARS